MNRNDPNVSRQPGLESLSRRGDRDDFDETTYRYGLLAAAIIAAVALMGAMLWVLHEDSGIASRAAGTDNRTRHEAPAC
jgi:hypothetical protein